jgi:4-amino-4-deoxy-L-arabinose transferase-like glycosyltransferase
MHAPRGSSPVHPSRACYRLALGGVVLLAFGLRLVRLDFQPLWWDEGWSFYFAAAGFPTLLERTSVDIHPPLYYLLLRAWSEVVGWGALSARLFSVAAGTATVPLLFLAGQRLLGRGAGIVAALLLAVSPLHIYYSQEVRMYGLVTLFGLAALLCAAAWQAAGEGARRWGSWLGYVLAATAALHTQYYAAFLILGLNVAVLAGWPGRRPGEGAGSSSRPPASRSTVAAWLGAQLAVLLLSLPWLLYAGRALVTYVRFKISVEQDPSLGVFEYVARHLSAFYAGHAEGGLAPLWCLGLLPLGILLLALLARGPGQGRQALGGMAWPLAVVGAVLLCGYAVNRAWPFNPPRSERLLLLALPAGLLLVAGGLVSLARRGPRLAAGVAASFIAVALISLGFFYAVPRYPQDDYRPVAARIQALGLPADAVVCVHPWQWGYMRAYIPRDDVRPDLVLTPREIIPRERQIWADEPASLAAGLDTLLERHGRVWLLDHRAMGRVLEGEMEAYLVQEAYPVLDEWHGESTVLSLYAAGEPAAVPTSATFGDWLVLEAAALGDGPLEAGWGVLPVDLTWRLSGQGAGGAVVGLRLVGATGHVWAQRDAPPLNGLLPFASWPPGGEGHDRHGLLVPAGTPPGDYRLALRVYDAAGLQAWPATFEGGSGGEVTLGSVRVVRPSEPPPIEALAIAHPLDFTFGSLRLLGANVQERGPLLPGEAIEVELFWQAVSDPGQDLLPRLQLVDGGGQVVSDLGEKPVAGSYPTAWWRAGELVRDPHALPVGAGVEAGRYRLVLSLLRAADGSPVASERGLPSIGLGEVDVQGRERVYQAPAVEHRQEAAFGPAIALAGYDLAPQPAAPGSTLAVTLTWHALDTPQGNYHSFVHLLDASGTIVAQDDGPPGKGSLPTLGWLPGEYLVDGHALSLPADLPAGQYRLAVGLYDPVTFRRPAEPTVLNTPVTVVGGEGRTPAPSVGTGAPGTPPCGL